MIIKYVNMFQTLVVKVVIVMMALVILSAILEIGWILAVELLNPPVLLVGVDEILDMFGLFFLVIIGIELLETVKMIIIESSMNVDVIILVGVTAVIRKVVILDIKNTDPFFLMGMGVLIVALAATYYLITSSEKEFKCSLDFNDEE